MTLRFVEKLRDVIDGVDVILSDIWGVVHNGLESFPDACAALQAAHERGRVLAQVGAEGLLPPGALARRGDGRQRRHGPEALGPPQAQHQRAVTAHGVPGDAHHTQRIRRRE
mgnify:CR=1 FL=1